MSYTPTDWTDGVTPINADNLNKIEEQLKNTSVDYIVEQDVSNGWRYRKWNSGRYDAQRLVVITSSDTSSAGVPGIDVALPFASSGTKYATATMNIHSGITFNPHVYLSCFIGEKVSVCVSTAPSGTSTYLVTVKIEADWK